MAGDFEESRLLYIWERFSSGELFYLQASFGAEDGDISAFR